MNEKELIKRCQRGEKQAFEELIRMFYPYVSKFLLKSTGNNTLSEDLTQETFLKMIRNIERFDIDGKAAFGTWLVAIAKNCYIDYMRRNNVILENIDDMEYGIPGAEEQVLTRLAYEEARKAIDALPPEQGLAIRLKYEENLTLEEIALKFGVEPKTVKSRIHEGTVKLRKLLNPKGRDDGYE